MMDTERRQYGQAIRPGEAVVVGSGIGKTMCVRPLAHMGAVEPGLRRQER